jgi:prolyl oligopeptidase
LLTTVNSPVYTFYDVSFNASSQDIFLLESSFCYPFSLWHINGSTIGSSETPCAVTRRLKLYPESTDEAAPVSTRQVFYTSTDGTEVPMFLTAEDCHPVTGQTPVLLYVYGGFGISVIPHFRPEFLAFIRAFRGVLAVANVRGGGEYGLSWYRAACKEKRQVLFDDIHCAIKSLKDTIGSEKIILMGESMGGLNCMTATIQQPDLVSASILNAGLFDILRKRKLGLRGRGDQDVGDAEVPKELAAMLKWSPLENLQVGRRYPPMLMMAGDKDDLVTYSHSCKMAASLQHAGREVKGHKAVHLRVMKNLGHGGNISPVEIAKIGLERWLWVKKTLGLAIYPRGIEQYRSV